MSIGYIRHALLSGMICAAELDTMALKMLQGGFTLEQALEQVKASFGKYTEVVNSAVAEVEQQVMDQADAMESSGGRSS